MSSVKYFESAGLDPAVNLAREDELFRAFDGDPVLYLWRNRLCVILGKNQVPEEEVDLDLAARLGIPVLRRSTGGGAVFQDEGNLNFTLILRDLPGLSPYDWALRPVLDALLRLNVPVEYNGKNDLCVRGKKVSGCASRVRGDVLLLHGTLLVSVDLETLDAVLTPPVEKLERNGVASVRSRVANLTEFRPGLTDDSVKAALRRAFAEAEKGEPS